MNKGREERTNEGTTVISLPCHAVGLATPDSLLQEFKVQRLRSDALTSKRTWEEELSPVEPRGWVSFSFRGEAGVQGYALGQCTKVQIPAPPWAA